MSVHFFKFFILSAILSSCLLLPCSNSEAHSFTTTNASVELFDDDQFKFSLNVDLINIIEQQKLIKGSGDNLIEKVQNLTKMELFQILQQLNSNLRKHIIFNFDNKAILLDKLTAPGVYKLKLRLSQNSTITDYRVTFTGFGHYPIDSKHLSVFFPEEMGEINFQLSTPINRIIKGGIESDNFILGKNNISRFTLHLSTVLNYIYQGIIHIIPQGFDHILFVLALFLLCNSLSALLWQISAFTIAHTVTLALGIFGILNVPSAIVEPFIALSIAYIAIENIFQHQLKSSRIAIVFVFGLLHGLGFASALLKFGLPPGQWLSSLISFNVGVEIGQLLVIACAFILLGWARKKTYYQKMIATPLSVTIAFMGTYWFIQRVFF